MIVYWERDVPTDLGVVGDWCHECRRFRVFTVTSYKRVSYIYFIPLAGAGWVGSARSCWECETAYECDEEDYRAIIPDSMAGRMTLREIILRTNPRMKKRLPPEKPRTASSGSSITNRKLDDAISEALPCEEENRHHPRPGLAGVKSEPGISLPEERIQASAPLPPRHRDGSLGPTAGSSPADAIIVGSVKEEYDWMLRNCPGFRPELQSLQFVHGKPYDVLTWGNKDGDKRTVYFDISGFFGKLPLEENTGRTINCRNCQAAITLGTSKNRRVTCPECGYRGWVPMQETAD